MLTKQVKLKHTASPSPAPKKKSRIAALFLWYKYLINGLEPGRV